MVNSNLPESQIDKQRNLTDWVTGIFGIFWSVWWGFFVNEILKSSVEKAAATLPNISPPFSIQTTKLSFLIVSSVTLAVFASVFVRWLWEIHGTVFYGILLSKFWDLSNKLGLVVLFLFFGIVSAGIGFRVPGELIWYGSLLTFLWPITVLITVWQLRKI